MKTCTVMGLGYIGLPTAAILANSGYRVFGVDINPSIVKTINKGLIHIKEPNLKSLVSNTVLNNNLSAHPNPSQSDVFLITVPTPFEKTLTDIPKPNLEYVFDAATSISKNIQPGNLIIIESTCPVGTTEKVHALLSEESGLKKEEINIAYCPERVLPGNILNELVDNDRVIGGLTPESAIASKLFYESFCKGTLHITDAKTAELVKLSENAFRDINIAYANELSMICNEFSIDVRELIKLSNKHPRVNILNPGCGVGGHCIAVDPWFIASALPDQTHLIRTARLVNENKISWVISEVKKRSSIISKKIGRPAKIGCFGLSFKPNIDDLRESPALRITEKLIKEGYDVFPCEPNINSHPTIELYSINEVMESADLLLFLVAHSSFMDIDTSGIDTFDLCGIKSSQ